MMTTTTADTKKTTRTKKDILSTQQQLELKGITPLYSPSDNDTVWVNTLYDRMDRIRLHCGDLCSMNDSTTIQKFRSSNSSSEINFHISVPNVDCHSILSMEEIDEGDMTFPEHPPVKLVSFYSIQGDIPIHQREILKYEYLGAQEELVWTRAVINEQIQQAKERTLEGSYGAAIANHVQDQLLSIKEKLIHSTNILVIGSEYPWVEAILLSLGVPHVTTLEYRPIRSEHENLSTETPLSIRQKFLNGTLTSFDGIVSHSSIEHSGLGRYGDALNPWGDILAVARSWCLTKSDGFLALGLPTHDGQDEVIWNWHRVYGKIRWPLVTANWVFMKQNEGEYPWSGGGDKMNIFMKK